MQIENTPRFHESGIDGPAPVVWYGKGAVDGDAYPFLQAPAGSLYFLQGDQPRVFQKLDAAGRDTDWAMLGGVGVILERVTRSQFTDGGSTSGTKTLAQSIPIGAVVLKTVIVDVTGFTGDTSAALTVGDGTDVDRYNTSTLDVFSAVNAIDGGAISGTAVHASAAKAPVLTITSASDFTNVTAGALTVKIFYLF